MSRACVERRPGEKSAGEARHIGRGPDWSGDNERAITTENENALPRKDLSLRILCPFPRELRRDDKCSRFALFWLVIKARCVSRLFALRVIRFISYTVCGLFCVQRVQFCYLLY